MAQLKKHMASALALACILALAGCGDRQDQDSLDRTVEAEPQVWVDYWNHEGLPWDGESDLNLAEYPETTFRWTPYKVMAVKGEDETVLFEGMPIWNVFLADLDQDGLPEFCATISVGSGIVDNRVVVYDYEVGERYELSDRGAFDYTLAVQDGRLAVTKSSYNGPEVETGVLVLNADKKGIYLADWESHDGLGTGNQVYPDGKGVKMYERMLNKQEVPTVEEMTAYCGGQAESFTSLNEWLSRTYGTEQKTVFPYGNRYGWGIAHRIKRKLVCNIFAEDNAFTVMLRLSDKQFESAYPQVRDDTKEQIDHKYPCGDGGWIQYRVTSKEQVGDIQTLLSIKCSRL